MIYLLLIDYDIFVCQINYGELINDLRWVKRCFGLDV
uniref:Uncharacterized protein n=1 Tax=Rhizophora mucronata TaxID=61149 RepID=A0A2P2PM20_RHIMU